METKKDKKQNFINEYLKEYEPFVTIKHKNFIRKMAVREYNKKILKQTPERFYDVKHKIPFGAIHTYKRVIGKNGYDAFKRFKQKGDKFISATLSSNQEWK